MHYKGIEGPLNGKLFSQHVALNRLIYPCKSVLVVLTDKHGYLYKFHICFLNTWHQIDVENVQNV